MKLIVNGQCTSSIYVAIKLLEVNSEKITMHQQWMEMKSETGKSSVPQPYINASISLEFHIPLAHPHFILAILFLG